MSKQGNQVETQVLSEILIQEEKILSGHRDSLNFLEMQADRAVRGERVAQTKLSDAQYHTRRLLEEQKNYLLSGAQSDLDKQELRVQCADSALHESGVQPNSQRMEFHQTNQ